MDHNLNTLFICYKYQKSQSWRLSIQVEMRSGNTAFLRYINTFIKHNDHEY